MTTTTTAFDQAQAEAFAGRMLTVLNDGALALMLSIGHRTGLLDTLAALPPSGSAAIAAAAGLQERYVREWLGALVTGKVVIYDPLERTYQLPAEHAALLTRAAPLNLAMSMQFIPVLADVEDAIITKFKHGGGLHYHDYPRFHEVMAENSAKGVVAILHDAILPLVPGLTERLSEGIEVLDLGCGQGRALLTLARAFPNSRFTGYDLTEDTITTARRSAAEQQLTNVRFAVMDAAALDEPARYDLIFTFDAIHDQANPARVLSNIYHSLRAGGVYLMQDIRASSSLEQNLNHPAAVYLYTISTMHCMSVSLGTGGVGLGTMWGEELALDMLADAGFGAVAVKQLPADIINNYYVARKPEQ